MPIASAILFFLRREIQVWVRRAPAVAMVVAVAAVAAAIAVNNNKPHCDGFLTGALAAPDTCCHDVVWHSIPNPGSSSCASNSLAQPSLTVDIQRAPDTLVILHDRDVSIQGMVPGEEYPDHAVAGVAPGGQTHHI